MKKILAATTLALALMTPVFAAAETSVANCQQNGSASLPPSIGSFTATGSIYVPVADATVELNTGTLVYKECVLRELVDRLREAASITYGRNATVAINSGRHGDPLYVVNPASEMLTGTLDPTGLKFLQGSALSNLSAQLQSSIKTALARNYEVQRNTPGDVLKCPFAQNSASVWDSILATGTACNPIIAYGFAQELMGAQLALAQQYQTDQWNWGRGYYPLTDAQGNVLTPAATVQESYQTILDSPTRQLENANNVGEMIGALYAGLETQIISGDSGLSGLTQSLGGAPSYFDQAAKEAGLKLADEVNNISSAALGGYLQIETQYLAAVKAIAAALSGAQQGVKDVETQCWSQITTAVCAGGTTDSQHMCTAGGVKYKIVPDTSHSASVLASIASASTTNAANISTSQGNLDKLNTLKSQLADASTRKAAQDAVSQLGSYYTQRKSDLASVQSQRQQIGDASTLVQSLTSSWTDSGGWCDTSNVAALQAKYKQ